MNVVRERGPPRVMPVTVPVTQSPGTVNTQIAQHLAQQMDARVITSSSAAASGNSSGSAASSSGTISSLISPQSDMSASPVFAKSLKSPAAMPPPLGTPTRLQTLRNQSLKLHLPGSGRSYISLGSGGSTSPGGRRGRDGGDGDEGAGPGTKPHLRVKIPGQKGFVPRTQAISPLPQMELTTAAISGAKNTTTTTMNAQQRSDKDGPTQTTNAGTTHTESLTTPVLSLATPNLLSALPPPLFSGLSGDFPFSAFMSGGLGSGTSGGGGGGELSSALVAFPVSIQPSSTSGGNSSAGNIVLQAQNMGQPFLLTPNVDPRQNPLLSQTTFTPPPSSSSLSPNVRDLEQLKHQYERVQQQLLQQQLFISQQLHHQQQQILGGKEGGGTGAARKSTPVPPSKEGSSQHKDTGTSGGGDGGERPRTQLQTMSPSLRDGQEDMDTGESVGTPPKRRRVESSPDEQPTSV
ncbi:hypothetical protein GBAR_LOCUS19572 [Geodia barretti]|nr:hypothetical protein GBAR_LOCUS19572 [Geodia barretti]